MWDDGNSLAPREVQLGLCVIGGTSSTHRGTHWFEVQLRMDNSILVSMISANFEDNHLATGFGNHLARPILHGDFNENLSLEDGVKLLEKCVHVLLCRGRSAANKLQERITYLEPRGKITAYPFMDYVIAHPAGLRSDLPVVAKLSFLLRSPA
ncbi:hypothetical protein NL676_022828 [Syzygium grande]|nr:hypothetical protein NL676_022828 [Syzygium grande]